MRGLITAYAPDQLMAPHEHDVSYISFVLAGAVHEAAAGDEASGRIGSIVFKPAGFIHANRFSPHGAVMAAFAPPHFARLQDVGWRWLHGRCAVKTTFALLSDFRTGDRFGRVEEAIALLADAVADKARRGQGGKAPPWLCEVRDRLHADPLARPSVFALAQELDMHPVALTRRFRKSYGRSISDYVSALRAAAAADRLAATNDTLTAIASDLGFADQSHLTRVFKSQFGVAPGRYRALIAGVRAAV